MVSFTLRLLAIVFILALTTACSQAALSEEADPGDLPHGIAAFQAERIGYNRAGQRFRVHIGAPAVVAIADKPLAWGYFQFPTIAKLVDGSLCVQWHMAPDSATAYGSEMGEAVSHDGGRTWTPAPSAEPAGLLLPNGDRLEMVLPKSLPVSSLKLPEPMGDIGFSYGTIRQQMYRLSDLPPELTGIPLRRKAKGTAAWTDERAALDDLQALRYQIQGVFPVVCLGDMLVLPDNSLLAGIYPGYRLQDDGKIDPKVGVFIYRSTDNGHHWTVQGRIPYRADISADPKADRRGGYTEPATTLLSDGSLLCVMRTTDGAGIGPLFESRSTDLGRTWSAPRRITGNGVLPRLLRLENGILVLSSGRPGVQVRFCTDGKGERWSEPFEMMPWTGDVYAASCGYTSLVATGPNRFLIATSDFRYPAPDGARRKAILVREVTVTP